MRDGDEGVGCAAVGWGGHSGQGKSPCKEPVPWGGEHDYSWPGKEPTVAGQGEAKRTVSQRAEYADHVRPGSPLQRRLIGKQGPWSPSFRSTHSPETNLSEASVRLICFPPLQPRWLDSLGCAR